MVGKGSNKGTVQAVNGKVAKSLVKFIYDDNRGGEWRETQ